MSIWMVFLVGFGLAFDVFAIAVAQGAVLRTIKLFGLTFMCLILCAWQVMAISIGYLVASIPNVRDMTHDVRMVWSLLAATILIAIGCVKLYLVYYKKEIPEERAEIDFIRTCKIAASTSIDTFFAGMACGFLLLSALSVEVMICVMTAGLVIGGVFLGYRHGEINKKIYWSGSIILIIAGLLVIGRYFIWYFG